MKTLTTSPLATISELFLEQIPESGLGQMEDHNVKTIQSFKNFERR
jgi:hypothetical protein